jgi:hypothetical protein
VPELARFAESSGRARRVALREVGEPVCPLGARVDRIGSEVEPDRVQLLAGRAGRRGIEHRQRDLGLGRQQPGSRQAVPVPVLEASPDRGRGRLGFALREEQQRPARLRVLAHLVCL